MSVWAWQLHRVYVRKCHRHLIKAEKQLANGRQPKLCQVRCQAPYSLSLLPSEQRAYAGDQCHEESKAAKRAYDIKHQIRCTAVAAIVAFPAAAIEIV